MSDPATAARSCGKFVQYRQDTTGTGQDGTPDMGQDVVLDRLDVTAAAVRLGLSVEGVRKRIQRGQLVAEKQDGRWYVVLPAQDAVQDQPDNPPDTSRTAPDNSLSDLVRLVEKQQRDLIELAGRCGWLQSELEQARAVIRQLQAPNPVQNLAQGSDLTNWSAEAENGPDSSVQKAGSAEISPERPSDAQNSPVSGETLHTPSGQQNEAERRPWWRFWQARSD